MKNNITVVTIFTVVVLTAAILSCKKIVTPEEIGINRGQTIVRIATSNPYADTIGSTARPDFKSYILSVSPTPVVIEFIEVRRDVASVADLNIPMTVIVEDDPGVLSAISSDIKTISDSAYTVDPSNPKTGNEYTITFAPGEFAKTLRISVNTSLMNLSQRSGLGFTIKSVTGNGKISSSFVSRGVELALNNQYDGVYLLKGYILRNVPPVDEASTGWVGPKEVSLATNGVTSVRYVQSHGWANTASIGIAASVSNPTLTVNPVTNAVTITSDGGLFPNGLKEVEGQNSRYDPATKTFYTYATWSGGPASRLMSDTLEYLRPR